MSNFRFNPNDNQNGKVVYNAGIVNGIVTLAGSRLYTSLADTPEIIDEALNRFEEVFKHVSKTDKGLVK